MTSPSTALPGMLAGRLLRRAQEETGVEVISYERTNSLADYAERIAKRSASHRGVAAKIIVCSGPDENNGTGFVGFAGVANLHHSHFITAFTDCSPMGGFAGGISNRWFMDCVGGAEDQLTHPLSHQQTHGDFLRSNQSSPVNVASILEGIAGGEQSLAQLIVANYTSSRSTSQENWFEEAQAELHEVLEESENLEKDEMERLFTLTQLVMAEAAALHISAPTVDLDHDKNVELFWKAEEDGLLAVVKLDGSLHFFGNSVGESWRSNYLMSGHVWRKHLITLLGPFRRDVKHT